jgi:hypothetical protein
MSLTILLGVIAFLAATLGAGISIWPPPRRAKRCKWALFAAFVVLGAAGLVLAAWKDHDDRGFQLGGDSGYFLFDAFSQKMQFVNPGPYPLYDLTASFFDQTRLREDEKNGAQKPLASYSTSVHLPDSYKQDFLTIPVALGNSTQQDFNIQFNEARKGSIWIEEMRLRLVNGVWVSAIRVPHMSFERIDPRFPRDAAGKVDWN